MRKDKQSAPAAREVTHPYGAHTAPPTSQPSRGRRAARRPRLISGAAALDCGGTTAAFVSTEGRSSNNHPKAVAVATALQSRCAALALLILSACSVIPNTASNQQPATSNAELRRSALAPHDHLLRFIR